MTASQTEAKSWGGSPLPGPRKEPLSGWGRLRPELCSLYRPETVGALGATLARAGERTLLSRGLGRSYGDAAVNGGGGVILHERLDRILAFDSAAGELECEAGLSLDAALRFLLPRGFFLPVVPGTRFITVGGAIAADVHGKNHHVDGTFGRFVRSLDLLLADGTAVRASRQERPDLFRATLGGMGLTGAIVSARLDLVRIETAHVRVEVVRMKDLETALRTIDEEGDSHRYSVAWIDCLAKGGSLGRSVLLRGEHLPAAELPARLRGKPLALPRASALTLPFDFPPFALSPVTIRTFNALYYASHRDGSSVSHIWPFFFPLDGILRWNRMYGRRGFVQYQPLFPPETAREGLTELLGELSASQGASFLAVLKRTGAAGEGLLSFPRPGYTLALDLPNTGEALVATLGRLDRIVLRHGGRLYLAKDALMSPEAFAEMYPALPQFRAARALLDPAGRLSSSQARRLRIVEGA